MAFAAERYILELFRRGQISHTQMPEQLCKDCQVQQESFNVVVVESRKEVVYNGV